MNRKKYVLLIPTFLILLSGCSRKFLLDRSNVECGSPWGYPRGNIQATAQIDSPFNGRLNLKWEKKLSEGPVGPLTLGGANLIFCGSKGRIYFLNPETGKYQGRLKAKGAVQGGVKVVDSLAYFCTTTGQNRLVCINLLNRKTIWEKALRDATGMPIIIDDRLILSADSGTVYCIDRYDGNILWKNQGGARSIAGPSYDIGVIYLPTEKGKLLGYEMISGSQLFATELGEPLVTKVALGDKVYVTGANGGLSAIEKKTGQIIWSREFPWPVWTAPALDDKMVFVGDGGGSLMALEKSDGRTAWEFRTDGVIISSPIVVGRYLIFASLDKNIYCINRNNGLLVSKRKVKHEIRFPLISDGRRIFGVAHDGTIQSFED